MKKRLPCLVCAGAVLVQLTGCTSYYDQQRDREFRRQTAVNTLRTDLQRLQSRVEGLGTAQEDLYQRLDALQTATARTSEEQSRALDELRRAVHAAEAERTQMQKDIIESLSAKVADVMRAQKPVERQRTQQGYEHVVESGQTISEIASAYNVTVRAIAEANGLRDPNQIRAGQTLFIPE